MVPGTILRLLVPVSPPRVPVASSSHHQAHTSCNESVVDYTRTSRFSSMRVGSPLLRAVSFDDIRKNQNMKLSPTVKVVLLLAMTLLISFTIDLVSARGHVKMSQPPMSKLVSPEQQQRTDAAVQAYYHSVQGPSASKSALHSCVAGMDVAGYPLVTLMLLTCNRHAFANLALSQVVAQDYPGHIEVIIVDDGPAVFTVDAHAYPFAVHTVRLQNRMTIGEKRNAAIRAASGVVVVHCALIWPQIPSKHISRHSSSPLCSSLHRG